MLSPQLAIASGQTSLGLELGSTRIKAVLIGSDHQPLAIGSQEWDNQFIDRIWTYSIDAVREGVQGCYAALVNEVQLRYNLKLENIGALGISAMMHGYLALDQNAQLLTPFRTWRNTITEEASTKLSELFGLNIPQRWSIAHLYQAILNSEPHVSEIAHLTTLSGYVHWILTGKQVLGIGDASGMFPIDLINLSWDAKLIDRFDELETVSRYQWNLGEILPQVLVAGSSAGYLSSAGAKWLDPTGTLKPGVPCCPPEGDAGTGMVATNSVAQRSGNISAGTSIFAMVVLEEPLKYRHDELDLVATPSGDPVAMVHCNNGASELNTWISIFHDFAELIGDTISSEKIFNILFNYSLTGDPDCGKLLTYNYLSGEHITKFSEGRPLILRTPDSHFNLANLIRAQLFTIFSTLKLGMEILFTQENVQLESMFAHGGLFKTKGVAQRYLAAALNSPVTVADSAGEGGAWGMALLAAYLRERTEKQNLVEYLNNNVFVDKHFNTIIPDPVDVAGFAIFNERFVRGLDIERVAIEST